MSYTPRKVPTLHDKMMAAAEMYEALFGDHGLPLIQFIEEAESVCWLEGSGPDYPESRVAAIYKAAKILGIDPQDPQSSIHA